MADQPKATPEQVEAVRAALAGGFAIVCYAMCWPCQFGQHITEAHTWMDDEDIEFSKDIDMPTNAEERAALAAARPCGCHCNKTNRDATGGAS